MQLYYAPNTIAAATAIALEEAGLEYEAIRIDFAAKEQAGAAYAQINPKGRVPALAVDGGILTETPALLEYIAELVPEKQLMPEGIIERARLREVISYLASTMHVNHAHKLRGARWAAKPASCKDMKAKVPQTMAASCDFICRQGLRGPFVLGEQFSIADCHLYTICTWLEGDGVTLADYPKLQTFMAAMEARDSVRAVHAKGML